MLDSADLEPVNEVRVRPGEVRTIEFLADNPGLWALRVDSAQAGFIGPVRFLGYDRQLPARAQRLARQLRMLERLGFDDEERFWEASLELNTLGMELELEIERGKFKFELHLEAENYDLNAMEAQAVFKRALVDYLSIIAGAEKLDDWALSAIFGVEFTLPLEVRLQTYAGQDGRIGVRISREFEVTDRWTLGLNAHANRQHDVEAVMKLLYRIRKDVELGLWLRAERGAQPVLGIGISKRF